MKTNVPHPCNKEKDLWLTPDVPHILKNIRCALCKGQDFELSEKIVKENGLPSSTVKLDHIMELLKFQET